MPNTPATFFVGSTYTMNAMNATKRIVVKEEIWAALSSMRRPGMTFSELIEEMIEHEKKRRLVEDIKRIQESEELMEIQL
ncbi:MAG: hypothetical protein PWR25_1631 [Euryarchaeota archaeon]|jgi:predicted CopG family antitoxin|nr:hypothetical protein [Euryarchaeota archaeon]MDN5340864.1 hypothetical protein [Euryarchaeota archaeon]